jgi:CRP-like cAMP-binding protein
MSADLGKQRVEHELFLRAFLSTNPPDRVATQLSRVTRDTHLVAGDVLFEVGESPERLHFVASGRIRLEASEVAPWSVDAGSLLGVLDASIPRPRTRTATAIESTHVLALDFVDYLDILEDNFGFAVDTLRSAARSHSEVALQLDSSTVFRPASARSAVSSETASDPVQRVLVLQKVGLFRCAPAQSLVQLSRLAVVRSYASGEGLFAAGDPVKQLSIVVAGRITASHQSAPLVGEFGVHQVVGDLEVLAEVHQFSAQAVEPSVAIELDVEDLLDVAEDHFDLWRSMSSYIASERARLNEAVSRQGSEIGLTTL